MTENNEDKLASSKYKLARAKHHIAEFESLVETFLSSNPYAQVIDDDVKTGEKVLKVKLVKPFPIMLNGVAFDAILNLRSALDNAGYAVSVAGGGRGRNTHFPFSDDGAIGVAKAMKGGSSEIPAEIFSVMESFKPYKGGNDLLWSLNKLSNAEKHRITCPIAITTGRIEMNLAIKGPMSMDLPRWDRKKNEMELARMKSGAEFNYDFKIRTSVALGEVDFVLTKPAPVVFARLADLVGKIIDGIEAEAFRIGLFKT